MFEHEYFGKATAPDLDALTIAVMSSAMSNKSLAYCTWNEELARLVCVFETQLLTADRIILDSFASAA